MSLKTIPYRPIPKEYGRTEVAPGFFVPSSTQPGKIRRVDYKTESGDKHAYVYLPYGYDSGKRYDVIYLMHGGGDRADKFIGTDDTGSPFKETLDNMIEHGDIRPVIVVAPSFYPMEDGNTAPSHAGELVANFHREFINDLMPAVESAYSTYAETTDPEGLKASRGHRAFGGFSMGSCTTWWQFIHSLDYVSTFLPLSGDCWLLGERGCSTKAVETVAELAKVIEKTGWKKDEFRIFAATGTKDIAFDALDPQVHAMAEHGGIFEYSDDPEKGNLHYILAEDKEHRWEPIWDYCYDIMSIIYPNK